MNIVFRAERAIERAAGRLVLLRFPQVSDHAKETGKVELHIILIVATGYLIFDKDY